MGGGGGDGGSHYISQSTIRPQQCLMDAVPGDRGLTREKRGGKNRTSLHVSPGFMMRSLKLPSLSFARLTHYFL